MGMMAEIPVEDAARAGVWRLLGRLLHAPPDAELLAEVAALQGDDTPLGHAIAALAAQAAVTTPQQADDEYHALFIGLTRGELVPFGSYYQTGFLNEKPLARLRADMQRLGIAKAEGEADPEDHVASLCEMMAGLIMGAFDAPACATVAREFFEKHLDSWIDVFFADLEQAENARLYAPVGALGLALTQIEREAFAMLGEGAHA